MVRCTRSHGRRRDFPLYWATLSLLSSRAEGIRVMYVALALTILALYCAELFSFVVFEAMREVHAHMLTTVVCTMYAYARVCGVAVYMRIRT